MTTGLKYSTKQTSDILLPYFKQNPDHTKLPYSKLVELTGIKDYRTIKKFLDETDLSFTENLSNSSVTSNYKNSKKPDDIEYPTLEEYCAKYHIPFEQVTSVKFVNHNGQAAWNAVCDLSKISEIHLDNYFDKLRDSLIDDIKPIYINEIGTSELAYHLYTADKHVGAETRDNSLYDNPYNAQIFELRMDAAFEDLIETHQLSGRFDKIFVADLGDSVDGWNGKTTRNSNHELPQNMDNKETFDVYVRVMCKWFDKLISLDLANSYEFFATSNDNHGGDFSYIVNRAVEIYLNLRYPQIKTRIQLKFIETYDYGKHTFMLCHGKDDKDLKHGMPLNLDQKTEAFINQYIDIEKLNDRWLHFIKADLHQESINFGRKFRYRNVLSLYGSSAWIMTNFGLTKAGVSAELVWKNKNKVMPVITTFT